MLGFLESILCVLQNLVLGIVWAVTEVINAVVAAIGALLAVLVALLPDMPDDPPFLSNAILRWLNWGLPVDQLTGIFGIAVGLWATLLVIRVAGRWMKLL